MGYTQTKTINSNYSESLYQTKHNTFIGSLNFGTQGSFTPTKYARHLRLLLLGGYNFIQMVFVLTRNPMLGKIQWNFFSLAGWSSGFHCIIYVLLAYQTLNELKKVQCSKMAQFVDESLQLKLICKRKRKIVSELLKYWISHWYVMMEGSHIFSLHKYVQWHLILYTLVTDGSYGESFIK